MALTLDMMIGPTQEAREKQFAQVQAREDYYATLRAAKDDVKGDQDVFAARSKYETTVLKLEELLGDKAHCNQVDCDLWSEFSDSYKAENGFRPTTHWTRQMVLNWFNPSSAAA